MSLEEMEGMDMDNTIYNIVSRLFSFVYEYRITICLCLVLLFIVRMVIYVIHRIIENY